MPFNDNQPLSTEGLPAGYLQEGDRYLANTAYHIVDKAPLILADTQLSPIQKTLALQIMNDASKDRGGFFDTRALVNAAVGAGLGYGAALLTGKILGSVFSIDPIHTKNLAEMGAVGGLLRATRIWK